MKSTVLKLSGSGDFFTQEAYKTLRTNVQFCGKDIRVIAVTSCHENEGKTLISLNLAKSLAELGKKVLLIDADMRKSVIAARHTNVRRPLGLSEALTGLAEVSECVYTTQLEQFHLIFSGKYPPNPVELLGSPQFAELLDRARQVYDYIIVDTPPLGRVIDAAVAAPLCDGTILVMSNAGIRYRDAKEVVAQLKMSGSKILGVVRNGVKPERKGYGKRKYYTPYEKG